MATRDRNAQRYACLARPMGPCRKLVLALWILAVCFCTEVSARVEGMGADDSRLNVILISLDTIRPDHLSCYGYHRLTTPNIDQIAKEGVIFTRAFSQAPSTLPSHLSIFTSRYPQQRWVFWLSADLAPSTESLVEVLQRYGYTTAAFTGFSRTSQLNPILTSRAFQSFGHHVTDMELKAPPEALYEWLQEHRDEPFFVFVHGFDGHEPHVLRNRDDAMRFSPTYQGEVPSTLEEYNERAASLLSFDQPVYASELERFQEFYSRWFGPPDRVLPTNLDHIKALFNSHRLFMKRQELYQQWLGAPEQVRPEDLNHLKALYDAKLYMLDQGLAHLFEALTNLELMERTIVVIFSDHGEAFGEHGLYVSHRQCYNEVTRMVLIVRDPRLERRNLEVHQLVQGIDIMPTLLELLEIPIPVSAQGRSLVPLLRTGRDPDREQVAISVGARMRAIRTPIWTLMSAGGRPAELYRVAEDPLEQLNLIARHPDVAARLQHRLDAIMTEQETEVIDDPKLWMREQSYW